MAKEHDELVTFLDATLDLLNDIVERPNGLVRNDFQQQLRHAWSEFDQGFDRDEARGLVRAIPRSRLDFFGLVGFQLALKLNVISTLTEIFGRKRWKNVLKKLLDAIDTLLESLLQAAGLSEALKEIKEAISNILDLPDENE